MDWKTRIPALFLWFALVISSLEDVNAEQRIVCYYTNWSVYRPGTAKFSPQNINPYLCTHLIYAFGGFTKENTLKPFDKYQDIEKGGYAKFTGLKTYNKNLKTMLAIGGWNEGSSRFSPMVADPGRRKEFVKNSVKFLRQNHFDGLDLDWEYPAFRDGGKPRDRKNYADLVQELREEFERESSKTGRPRLLLSMAVPAGIEYIDKGYDVPRLNDYLDFINLLSYDYHSAFEPAVNHHAPLYPLEEDNEYNYDTELTIDYTIEHLLKSGASSEKIVLGIPTYGRSYTLFNEEATEIGAPADGPGEEGDATREKGYLAYYEICESIGKSDEWEVVQPNPSAMGPYAFRENQWVGYDDEDIVRAKARYVNEKNLGGIMFWSIDNDDFRGKCHGRPYPLIEAAKEAMLTGDEKSTSGSKTKLSDRKKTRTQASQRIQGNTIGRRLSPGNRRTTTQASASRRKIGSSRSNGRSNARGANNPEDDSDDEDEEETNSVKSIDNTRTRNRNKSRSKNRSSSGGRRKQQHNSRRGQVEKEAEATNEESFSNKLTTPEPPTTPDPGSDFKCEDEGFFSHPRDCKKYFWCLDSGPSGLGIVGHQFTCPSGLVFNKAADSCDYPRNVVCPKAKASPSIVTTTRAPATTTTTSRTTYLYKPAKRTTTLKPETEEEYEYYDDEEDSDSEEVEEEPRVATTAKPLLYKTINRSRPTTTSTTTAAPVTTTTETTIAASTKMYKSTSERVTSFEDEEDPRVIKELIDLIRKAGGIDQLEKQLNYQEKNSDSNSGTTEVNGRSTPATISRSLYERVLNRQATRNAGSFLGSLSTTTQSTNGEKSDRGITKNSRIGFVNGPGGAQFEGLDNVPEVKILRRTNKPKYVTIERNRTPTSESPNEDDEEEIDDALDDDNTDVASSEDQAVSDPPQRKTSDRRVTPSYVNIRRTRPSATTSENDVEVKDDDTNGDNGEEEEDTVPRHRHRVVENEEESSSPKFRYTNIQRFRSTTSRNSEENQAEEVAAENDFTTESTTTTTTTNTEKVVPVTEEIQEAPSSSTTSELSSSSTLEHISSSIESTTSETTSDSSLQLVEDSATEILFTTAAASSSSSSSSSSSAGSSLEPITRGPSIAAALQPRPFGFPRRGRPTTSTSSAAPVTEQSRTKVDPETLGLPTLKELVGYTPTQTESIAKFTSFDVNALRDKRIDPTTFKDENRTSYNDTRDPEREIFDNDILGSEEIQRRSSSSSFVTEMQYFGIAKDKEKIDNEQSIGRIEVPVKILDDSEDEELGELVILRVPESKINSAILKPVFKVRVLERDYKSEKNGGNESVGNFDGISSENELPDDRAAHPRRRRIRINSSTASTATDNINTRNKPRSRQRIIKARRRTRVREVATGLRENDKNMTNEYTTTSRATTFRGNASSPSKAPNVVRGFYVTKSSFEISTTPEVAATNSTTTEPPAPSEAFDETTEKTDFTTKDISYVADESSTYESLDTTLEESENTTGMINGIDSLQHLGTSVAETGTSESISTIDDRTTESSTILTSSTRTTNDIDSFGDISTFAGHSSRGTVTPQLISTVTISTESSTFAPSTIIEEESSVEAATNPSTLTEVTTTEYSTASDGERAIEQVSKSLDTSENSLYRNFPSVEVVKSTTLPTTKQFVDDNVTVDTLKSKNSPRRTTIVNEQATTYKDSIKRGRVRFTTVAKTEVSLRDHLKSDTLIETREKSTKHDITKENTERSYTSSVRSRDHHRKTANSLKMYDTTVNSVNSEKESPSNEEKNLKKDVIETIVSHSPNTDGERKTTISLDTDFSSINSATEKIFTTNLAETYDKTINYASAAPEGEKISTNLVESTDNDASSDRGRKTTKSLDFFSTLIDSATEKIFTTSWPDAYDKAFDYTSATPEAIKISTNLDETSGSDTRSDREFETTKSLDSDSTSIDSGTEKIFTTNWSESSDKTIDYTSASPEAKNLSTNSIETIGSDAYSEDSRKSTKFLQESDFTIGLSTDKDFTTSPSTENYDEYTADYTNTYFVGTTESNSYIGTSSVEIGSVATTTEGSYDRITKSSEASSGRDTKFTKILAETTPYFAETTRPWSYEEQNRITDSTEENKTESINISNDMTETLPSTTEVYANTENSTVTETNDAESTTISATLAGTIYKKSTIPTQTPIENTTESTTEKFSSMQPPGVITGRTTIARQNVKKSYPTIDSSNTITPVTQREIKRSRGRVRFTNFAAITDDTGVTTRPVKQVVVRRRLATESKNRQRPIDPPVGIISTSEPPELLTNINTRVAVGKKNSIKFDERANEEKKHYTTKTRLAEVKDSTQNWNVSKIEDTKHTIDQNDRLIDDKINSTKSMRRRVVVYRGRPRAEIVTSTSTMQSLRASSDENSNESERTRRRKWRKRIVVKRARSDEADDQSIAETSDFRRAMIDQTLVNLRDIGSSFIEDHEPANEDTGGEVNVYKSSGTFLRRPGAQVRNNGINRTKTKSPGNFAPIVLPVVQTPVFSKIRPSADDIKTDDQSGRAQEVAVTLADPPAIRSSATIGRLQLRTTSSTRKISTTIAPRTEAPTTRRTSPVVRRRQKPKGNVDDDRIVEKVTTRPRRPAIIDYDYYVDDDDVRLVVKPELKDKLFVTRKGGIRCLDQGNFAHPTSCKKFITCARMVNGQVIGTEYTCPDKLSFDPVGGICNWSAGLGCEDKKI